MTPAILSALSTHLAPLAPALAGLPTAFKLSTTAAGGNVYFIAAVGPLPLVVFSVLMGVLKVAVHWCAIISLVIAVATAITLFRMPVGMMVMNAAQGMALGFAPIIYIIIAVVWLYNLTGAPGRSKNLKAVFNVIGKGDMRAQALIVAFFLCGPFEGLIGSGVSMATVAAMVATLGLSKLKAVVVVMADNAINVGSGAMAIPTATASKLGGQEPVSVATAMRHLTWAFCAFIPFLPLFILNGACDVKQLWPLVIVAGLATGVGHSFTPSISYELTVVLASLLGLAASYISLLVWTPTTLEEYRSQVAADDAPDREHVILALLPHVSVVVIIAMTKLRTPGVNFDKTSKATDLPAKWPGVCGRLLTTKGEASKSAIYNLQILSNPSTWIFLTVIIVTFIYVARLAPGKSKMSVGEGFVMLVKTYYTLRMATLTIAAVMVLAYVMSLFGQTSAIGAALAATGAVYVFLSPALGWAGTAVAGSATSAGAPFTSLQATAAQGVGLNSKIPLIANIIGGGLGKIVSPQNLAIVSIAVDAPGTDTEIFKKTAPYSVGLLLVLGASVFPAPQVGLRIWVRSSPTPTDGVPGSSATPGVQCVYSASGVGGSNSHRQLKAGTWSLVWTWHGSQTSRAVLREAPGLLRGRF